MSGLPFWNDDPESWDTITIAGKRMLGLAIVSVKKSGSLDPKRPPGSTGNLTHLGFEPAQVQITLRMWEREHWERYQELIDVLEPNGKAPEPVDVDHPALAAHSVRSLYFASIEPPRQSAVRGAFDAVFIAQEFKPKKASGVLTPTKSTDFTDPKNIKTSFGATEPKPPPSQGNLRP